MINVKENLTGEISVKNTLSGEMNVATMFVSPPLIDLEVIPGKEEQVFNHENSYGYDIVTVKAIDDEYIIPHGVLDITSNGIHDVKEYESANVNVELYLQEKELNPSKSKQQIVPDDDYDGFSRVTINPIPEEYIIPSGTKDIITNGYYEVLDYEGVNVNVEFEQNLQDKEVTPAKEQQVIVADESFDGLNQVIVNAVSNEIDSNIQPNNIKSGVSILGVIGTLQEGSSVSIEESTLVFSSGSVEEGELTL